MINTKMKAFYRIILSDYLQRTRSYAFLVTLAVSLLAAYMFVPAVNANYTTLRIGNYVGTQTSAWIGYVTAMMTAVFLSIAGFYLVNSSIKKDADTGVGAIIAASPLSNSTYLFAKALSNFLVLFTITIAVFAMSILLFFVRSNAEPFELSQFILPYLLVPVPAILLVASLAVVAESLLYRYPLLMNIGFFILFCMGLSLQSNSKAHFDLMGNRQATDGMKVILREQYHQADGQVSMGFIHGHKEGLKYFVFNGIDWSFSDIVSRLLLVAFGALLVFIASRYFHRFDIGETVKTKKKVSLTEKSAPVKLLRDIKLSDLPKIKPAYNIFPFVKTELLMLFRKGPRWLWFINLGGMLALIFTPLTIAHQIVLPTLWFLQVARLSDLATKEKTSRIHYFTYASYRPLTRILPAQIIAGFLLTGGLATPLIIRYLIAVDFISIVTILFGGLFIVLIAVMLGIVSGGKKLFEILFFFCAYANVQLVPIADYFGGLNSSASYIFYIGLSVCLLALVSFLARRLEISRL
jgi:hypothetical protein